MSYIDGNQTLFDQLTVDDKNIDPKKSTFWLIIISALLLSVWSIFLAFYLSRINGRILAFFINRYLRWTKDEGYLHIGSFSISLLSGKIMIRDFLFVNSDFSFRISDGWIIFSYWKFINSSKADFKSDTSRLHLSLNGVRIHWFNRTYRYKEIAKLFRLEKYFGQDNSAKKIVQLPHDSGSPAAYWDRIWSLVGMVRVDIGSGQMIVGNRLLPYMAVLSFEDLRSRIFLRESATDRALLTVGGETENVKMYFIKHPEYKGKPCKEPPRTMGDGFAVLQSANLEFRYNQDILGFVTDDKQRIDHAKPIWDSQWRFGSNTVISFGPWAEEQRALLYGFFFPPDYQTLPVTELSSRGRRRIHLQHEARISVLKETSIDIWFMRGEQLESIHSRCQAGSSVDISVWWITLEEGFSWSLHTSLLRLETTTSLPFTRLFECETVSIDANFHYPKVYNDKQIWTFNFSISKATMWFVWDHKRFFTNLIDEWMGEAPSDVFHFIPYVVNTKINVTESFEVILLLNEFNWVDASDKQTENIEVAIVGEHLNAHFELPFTDFVPETIKVTYTIKGRKDMAIRSRFPVDSATAPIFATISQAANCQNYAVPSNAGSYSKGDEWHEFWRTESVNLVLQHQYHPIMNTIQSDLPFAFLFDNLPKKVARPEQLKPDNLDVLLSVEGAEIKFTGLLIRLFLDLKNNYFGWYDSMTDLERAESEMGGLASAKLRSNFNSYSPTAAPEQFRHMQVDVIVRICNPRIHALLYSPSADPTEFCPILLTDEFVVEVHKTVEASLIQVALGPTCAYFDKKNSSSPAGYLTLSGLQFRGHGMYSTRDVPWDMGICEYAWLMEILVGDLKGNLQFPSNVLALYQILETTLLFAISPDDAMLIPERFKVCPHGQLQSACSLNGREGICEDEEKLKYRLVRVAVDEIDICMQEGNSILQLSSDPIRFSLCNAEQDIFTEHLYLKTNRIQLRQAIKIASSSPHSDEPEKWLETGYIRIDNIGIGLTLPLMPEATHLDALRREFVRRHDEQTKRLHFLWRDDRRKGCACKGDTAFFAEEDTIGKDFLVVVNSKLFAPSIIPDSKQQPGILQSVVNRNMKILSGLPYYAYKDKSVMTPSSTSRSKRLVHQQFSATDTDSYHSARSAASHDSVGPSAASLGPYEDFLNRLELRRSAVDGPPRQGETPIESWNRQRVWEFKTVEEGINNTQFAVSRQFSQQERTEDGKENEEKWKKCKNLTIRGRAGDSIKIFFTPIGLDSLESFISSLSSHIPKLHPAVLLELCYSSCSLKGHKQPLLESLFNKEKQVRDLRIDIFAHLPVVDLTLFQCEQPVGATAVLHPGFPASSANLLTVVFEGAQIVDSDNEQLIVDQTKEKDGEKQTSAYQLATKPISVQCIQLSHSASNDFRVSNSLMRPDLQWELCPLSKKMIDRQPRILFEFKSPRIVVELQRIPRFTKLPVVSPVVDLGTPSNLVLDSSKNTTNSERLTIHNQLKVEIDTVTSIFVMARALELTGKNEFPIYEALQPAIFQWINTVKSFEAACFTLEKTLTRWSDITMMKLLKLALDCTHEKVCVQSGKHRMAAVKRLGQQQCACGSCMLTLTLFKWCAFADNAEKELAAEFEVHEEFTEKKARKTALMALLSHWQPDISRNIKLTSLEEAARFKVQEVTPLNTMRSETRIDMTGISSTSVNATSSLSNLLHRSKHVSRGASNNVDEAVPTSADKEDKELIAATPKMDLYTWMLNAHRERKEKREGRKTAHQGGSKYVNPMDIVQKAFFYSIYRFRQLEWTGVEEVAVEKFTAHFEINLHGIDIKMVEQKIINSLSDRQSYVTQHFQNLIQLKQLQVAGQIDWQLENDKRSVTPLYGLLTVEYKGSLDGIKIAVDIGSMCLVKEVAAVIQSALDANLGKQKAHSGKDRKRKARQNSVRNATEESSESAQVNSGWEEKVIEIKKDFEKNMQLMKSVRSNKGEILTNIDGEFLLDSVRIETSRTDVYVSFAIHTINLHHRRLPIAKDPETCQSLMLNLSSSSIHDPNLTANTSATDRERDFDQFKLQLNKATLNVMESDSSRQVQNQYIFSAALSQSKAKFNRRFALNGKTNALLEVTLGDMKGDMPMSAQILHEVVMKHGPQIEQQLNRLSAQPPPAGSTPLDMILLPVVPVVVSPDQTRSPPSPLSPVASKEGESIRAPGSYLPRQHAQSLPPSSATSAPVTARRPAIATVNFTLEVRNIELALNPLPSLRVKYIMYGATSSGVTGNEANWRASITKHEAEFSVTTRDMENINLPLPSLSCVGQYTIEKEFGHHQKRPSTDKQLHYREGGYLQMMLTLGQVSHTFTTDLLNQILFAEQTFREDFKSLIKRLKSSDNKIKSMLVSETEPEHSTLVVDKPPLLFSLQVQGTGVPWLQLTASTPTNIAVRFTIDSFDAQLTNKWVVREEGSKKEKILGIAVIQLNAKLGQLVRAAQYAEVNQELQEFATFMTQVRVENKERTSKQNAYSYHISVNRPIILIKSTAIDKAILLWLNYKNTYDFWRSERSRLKNKTSPRGGNDETQSGTSNADAGKTYRQHRSNSLSQAMFSPQPIQDVDINLSLSITNGMYMCMPLFSQDVTEGMPALVMSLQKSDISVHIKKELACEAQFHEFKLNFVDHFDEQALSHNFVESRSDAQTNYFFFPSGSYKLCSKASVVLGEPQWMLSIRSEMRGMVIDLDHRIGKLTKLLVNTFSAFGENDDSDYCDIEDEQSPDPDVEKVEGEKELLSLPMDKRVPWLERKMHEQSNIVSELQAKNAAEKSIEVQTKKLRSYELLRFKEFRRTFVEKLKKREDKPGNVAKRSSGTNNAPLKKTLADITAIELPNRHSPGEETLDVLEGGSAVMVNGKDKGKNETVNMHIDVKISIESGSCTLRTAQKAGGQNEGRSGLTTRPSLRDLRQRQNREQISTTNFSIPSVDLKGYYTSDASHPQMSQNQLAAKLSAEKDAPLMNSAQQIHNQFIAQQKPGPKSQKNQASHIAVNSLQPQHHRSPSRRNSDLQQQQQQHRNSKRGCFYLFVGLASMPSETVVTPHLADYVEQVLEPLPPSSVFRSGVSFESVPEEEPEQENKVNNIVAMDTTILPLDITLYLNVQSSKILFDGMQQRSTAANCLLQLPRLTLMASTKRSDNSEYPGGVDISGTLSEFSLGIYSPHQDIRTKFALQLTLDHFCFVITRNKNASNELDNKVRFVLTSEVGSALIDFDCRRLSELIQFPKPWYRPAIMRRVFFGDQTAAPQATSRSRNSSNGSYNRPFSELNRSISSQHDTVKKPWMATVLLLMQWKQLRIEAQMGNTMGQTLIEARKGTLSSSAKLSSRTERDVTANFELESARFHAHTGAISGEIELNGMKMSVAHKRHFLDAALKQAIPHNSASLEFKLLSVRIEWMTRKVLVAHCVGPTLRLHDEYRTEETRDADGKMMVTKAVICLHVMGAWEDLQMIIARNTIEDFISIVQKLKTFFEEQLKSSKLVWGFTEDTTLKTTDIMGSLDEADEKADRPATAFWQKVLDEVTNLQYKEYLLKIPVEGNTIVGGNVTLKANQLSIACMHGEMTSNIWGLFHLKEPTITFKPTAKMIFIPRPEGPSDPDDRGELGVELQHEFTICLGNDEMKNVPNANKDVMGKVLRVQHHRNDMRLNVSVTQHLDYLIGEVLRQNRKQQKEKGASPNRSPHHVLVVFQFPALQALIKSTQVNAIDLDMSELSRMDVHSSFVVDFYDDVGVLTDVSTQVLFLPELLKSYFRVNDIPTSAELEKGTHKADQRLYICDQWQVAPRIKCIERSAFTWNPPLVDDILRKLQIFDYRTTIPKALQRTILDPLDAAVANVIFALLRLVTQAAKQGDRRRRRKTYHEAL